MNEMISFLFCSDFICNSFQDISQQITHSLTCTAMDLTLTHSLTLSLSLYHTHTHTHMTHTHNTHQLVKRIFELLKKTPDVIFLQSKEPSNSELRMRIMENVLHNVLRYIIHKSYTVQLFI